MERLNGSPLVFLAFALGETASPERSIGECGGGKISPEAKAIENRGLKCESEKKCPLPVNGDNFPLSRLLIYADGVTTQLYALFSCETGCRCPLKPQFAQKW